MSAGGRSPTESHLCPAKPPGRPSPSPAWTENLFAEVGGANGAAQKREATAGGGDVGWKR